MNCDGFILGVCLTAFFFNIKDFFDSKVEKADTIIYNIIIFVILLLISIGRIVKI